MNSESQQTPHHQKLRWESLQDPTANETADTRWLLPNQGYRPQSQEHIVGLSCTLHSTGTLFSVALLFSTHDPICLAGVPKPR